MNKMLRGIGKELIKAVIFITIWCILGFVMHLITGTDTSTVMPWSVVFCIFGMIWGDIAKV